MRKISFCILIIFLLCRVSGKTTAAQIVIHQNFPQRKDIGILCWSIPDQASGYLSQIVVFETDRVGISKLLWQSPLDNSYSPQIRFVPEIRVQDLPLVLVERQTGAASSELDAIGKAVSGFALLLHVDGFKFDVVALDGSKLPLIIAHRDASILDVPDIYRWNGSRFVEDSASHPAYYQKFLADERKNLPFSPSAAVLVNLAQIALLSGDRVGAKKILDDALAKERSKGPAADQEMLCRITKALHALAGPSH
jgi:hypothetical protein